MIYPGKVTDADTFRIGNIGHVFPKDIDELIRNVAEVTDEMGMDLTPARPNRAHEAVVSGFIESELIHTLSDQGQTELPGIYL